MIDETPFDDPVTDTESAPADPHAIEPLSLPSGGKIYFRSTAALTADNLRWLRGADDRDGQMAFYNEVQARAAHLLVESWDLTTPTGRPILIPRENRAEPRAYLKGMSAVDLIALERHLATPVMNLIAPPEGDGAGE